MLMAEECYKIIGVCMKVHSILGAGFNEVIYKDALEMEFLKNNFVFEREKAFKVEYDGVVLKRRFYADFVLNNSIILEAKSNSQFFSHDFAQTLNYLKVAKIELGLLVNFGNASLQYKRVICSA